MLKTRSQLRQRVATVWTWPWCWPFGLFQYNHSNRKQAQTCEFPRPKIEPRDYYNIYYKYSMTDMLHMWSGDKFASFLRKSMQKSNQRAGNKGMVFSTREGVERVSRTLTLRRITIFSQTRGGLIDWSKRWVLSIIFY